MTLHYPDTDAVPTSYDAAARTDLGTAYIAETAADDTIVPIYARKPVRKSYNKKLLMAVPVVLALGIGAWALSVGESSRSANDAATIEPTDGLTTSRLDIAQPISPEVDVPAVTEAVPMEAIPAPTVTSAPAARVTRNTTPTPTARRAAAPAGRAPAPVAGAAGAAVPEVPQPYNSSAETTVITEPTPIAAPAPTIASTPVLPADPAATGTPPGA